MKTLPACRRTGSGLLGLTLCFLISAAARGDGPFIRGNIDDDGVLNLSDPVQILRHLFQGEGELGCFDAADADDSGRVDLTDGIHILTFLFQGGPPPLAPFPDCGTDSSLDDLDCSRFPDCGPGAGLTVTGRTLDASFIPLTGARVAAGGEFTFSGIDGSFLIEDLAMAPVLHLSASLGSLSGAKDLRIEPGSTQVSAGDIVLTPGDACGNVVARAADRGCGRVFVWGDEHVQFDEYLPGSAAFWQGALDWLSEPACSAGTRTRIGFLGRPHDGIGAMLAGMGFPVTLLSSASELGQIDILIVPPFGSLAGASAVEEWVEEGGALMTLVAGVGDRSPEECEHANTILTPLGIEYDCMHQAPWGPVKEFSEHPIGAGLAPGNAPFVNGRWVVDVPGFTSEVVARAGDCNPRAVEDCRKPIAFDDTAPVNVVGSCEEGLLNGGSKDPAAATELNILGIYEPHERGGQVTVTVERTAPMVLVLAAYEPTHWVVELGPGAVVEKVILSGFEAQTATVPAGVEVENAIDSHNYGYGNDCGGGNTRGLVGAAEQLTALPLRSFHGCYRASGFRIQD